MKSNNPVSEIIADQAAKVSAASVSPHIERPFVTVDECADIRPFTDASLRDLRFKAFDRETSRGELIKGNGTGPAGVWVQIGSKVLIDLDRFDAWIASHRVIAATPTPRVAVRRSKTNSESVRGQ